MPIDQKKAERLINRFAAAVQRHDELGAIPVYSIDDEEQRLINRTRAAIKREHTSAYRALLKALVQGASP